MKLSDYDDPIYVWADGTWCYPEEIGEYDYMSDDYMIMEWEDMATRWLWP